MRADHYRSAAARAEFRQKIERSEFLAIVVPVTTEPQFFASLEAISKEHFDATHHCWAFRLFADDRSRSSDAGEPSGTAGKPILSAIEGVDLYDTGVIVVRWYGGVKLGTGGLSRAYRDTAAQALQGVTVADHYVYKRFAIEVSFDSLGVVYRLIDPPNVILAGESFGEINVFDLDVRTSMAETFEARLRELRLTLR